MTERIEVGYVCEKGRGHFSLRGMTDHGACGSHIAGYIYIESVGGDRGGRGELDLEGVADDMQDWVERADKALDKQAWDEYSASIEGGFDEQGN